MWRRNATHLIIGGRAGVGDLGRRYFELMCARWFNVDDDELAVTAPGRLPCIGTTMCASGPRPQAALPQ